MWIQVRTMDGKKSSQVGGLSKLTKIGELKKKLVAMFDIEEVNQRLFYRGKQVKAIIICTFRMCLLLFSLNGAQSAVISKQSLHNNQLIKLYSY